MLPTVAYGWLREEDPYVPSASSSFTGSELTFPLSVPNKTKYSNLHWLPLSKFSTKLQLFL